MRMRWKLLGLAGLAGVATTGVVVARRRRATAEVSPDQLRERLHQRLADVGATDGPVSSARQGVEGHT
jgi:hypothetical protein